MRTLRDQLIDKGFITPERAEKIDRKDEKKRKKQQEKQTKKALLLDVKNQLSKEQQQKAKDIKPFVSWYAIKQATNGTLIDKEQCVSCGDPVGGSTKKAPGSILYQLSKRFGGSPPLFLCGKCEE